MRWFIHVSILAAYGTAVRAWTLNDYHQDNISRDLPGWFRSKISSNTPDIQGSTHRMASLWNCEQQGSHSVRWTLKSATNTIPRWRTSSSSRVGVSMASAFRFVSRTVCSPDQTLNLRRTRFSSRRCTDLKQSSAAYHICCVTSCLLLSLEDMESPIVWMMSFTTFCRVYLALSYEQCTCLSVRPAVCHTHWVKINERRITRSSLSGRPRILFLTQHFVHHRSHGNKTRLDKNGKNADFQPINRV